MAVKLGVTHQTINAVEYEKYSHAAGQAIKTPYQLEDQLGKKTLPDFTEERRHFRISKAKQLQHRR